MLQYKHFSNLLKNRVTYEIEVNGEYLPKTRDSL